MHSYMACRVCALQSSTFKFERIVGCVQTATNECPYLLYRWHSQARRQGGGGGGGSKGFAQTLFASTRFYTQPSYIYTLPFVSGPLASLPLRITAVKTSSVAAVHPVCSLRTSGCVRNACQSSLCPCMR